MPIGLHTGHERADQWWGARRIRQVVPQLPLYGPIAGILIHVLWLDGVPIRLKGREKPQEGYRERTDDQPREIEAQAEWGCVARAIP